MAFLCSFVFLETLVNDTIKNLSRNIYIVYSKETDRALSVLTWALWTKGLRQDSKSVRKLSVIFRDNLSMAIIVSSSDLQTLEDCLLNKSGAVALHTRFRALFTLKNLKSENAVEIIAKGRWGCDNHPIQTNKYR